MCLKLAAIFTRRELRGGLRGFRILLSCLALGVAAIAAVGSVRSGIEAGLAREGASLLGGDAELDFTYRFASPEERAWMDENADAVSEIVDFRSMVVVARDSGIERGLTQVKAVDNAYPLIGQVELNPDVPLGAALAGRDGLPGSVMQGVLMDRLGLSVGDQFRIGTQDFVLMAELTREPDDVAGGFSLGPRTIVLTESLENASLITPGTLFSTKYRLDLPPETDLNVIAAKAAAFFDESGARWSDARDGAPGVSEFVDRLGAFLVLVGLSGLAVGGVGVSAAVRAYLVRKTSVIATLRTLGADRRTIFQTYFLQIGVLSVLGVALGLVLGGLAPVLLAPVIEARLPVPAEFRIFPASLAEAALYGLLTAFLFALWPLARTEDIRAASLYRDALGGGKLLPGPRYIALSTFALWLLVSLAAWFSGTWWLTLWTTGGIVGALLLLAGAGLLIRHAARRISRRMRCRPQLRWAFASISGTREGALSVVLSLGLGLSVLAAVGQVDGNLRGAIAGNLPKVAPSYFFVDIQKNQIADYTARLEATEGVEDVQSAPMLRGIITRINGRPAREVAGAHWVLEGDRGITYAARQPENTRILEGEWWSEAYTGPPLISFAAEEAEEMGLGLGDSLTINVLGRDITGTIASLREVDFSTAGIGFILSMNPAALEGAPHTFISTVYADEAIEAEILRDIAGAFPNVTAVRVRDAIDRVADVLRGLAAAISYGAAATLLTGFLVLIGAASAGTETRVYEAAIMKTLGATRGNILLSFAARSALLGLAAGCVALLAGILGGWAVSTFIMETDYRVIWDNVLAIIVGGVTATLLAGLAFALRPLNAHPARVLRAQE